MKKNKAFSMNEEIYDERLLDRKKTLGERLRNLTYMQAAMSCFGVGTALFVLSIVLSVTTKGDVGIPEAICGIAGFLFGAAGLGITLFGHFIVGIEGKTDWKVGLYCNLLLILLTAGLYVLGLF